MTCCAIDRFAPNLQVIRSPKRARETSELLGYNGLLTSILQDSRRGAAVRAGCFRKSGPSRTEPGACRSGPYRPDVLEVRLAAGKRGLPDEGVRQFTANLHLHRLASLKFLKIPRSTLRTPGPSRRFRPAFPLCRSDSRQRHRPEPQRDNSGPGNAAVRKRCFTMGHCYAASIPPCCGGT